MPYQLTQQRNLNFINVKDYGATGNGTSDDTAAITAAITAANNTGGGAIFYPAGTYLSGPQTLYSNVYHVGCGRQASIIKLKNGANADLFSAQTNLINLSAAANTGANGTLSQFGFENLTLDGNKANQSAGPSYVLRFYGFDYRIENCEIRNGYSGGMLSDWNGGASAPAPSFCMAAKLNHLDIHDNGGFGLEMGGPHDTQMLTLNIYNSGTSNVHFAPNFTGHQVTNSHFWNPTHGVNAPSILIEAPGFYENCEAEGSDVVQVACLSSGVVWIGGHIFVLVGGNITSSGIQIGQQAGNAVYPGMTQQSGGLTASYAVQNCYFETFLSNLQGSNGAAWMANDGGYNTLRIHLDEISGGGTTTNGRASASTNVYLTQHGITSDGTVAKGGYTQIGMKSQFALAVTDATTDRFNVNTSSNRVELPNGTYLRLFSDNYSTITGQLINGTLCVGQTSSAQAIASNGAVTGVNSNGMCRVAPTGNVTGITLPSASQNGQTLRVINESAFTVTFDVAGTSKVADGASCVIAANTFKNFVWDSSTSLWYHS